MRSSRVTGLVAAALVSASSLFGAAACGGGSEVEGLRQRAEDEVRQRAADGIRGERVEEGLDRGLTRAEGLAEEGVGRGLTPAEEERIGEGIDEGLDRVEDRVRGGAPQEGSGQ